MNPSQGEPLSCGIEELFARLSTQPADRGADFDVLIVGSGYGGAIAARQLSGLCEADGTQLRVAVLERGKEYLAGGFPNGDAELPGHLRVSLGAEGKVLGRPEALIDMKVGGDVGAVVANGVGGGSLINAGVMARADRTVFAAHRGWPAALVQDLSQPSGHDAFYDSAQRLLAPKADGSWATVAGDALKPAKHQALKRLAGKGPFAAAPLSVSLEGGPNAAGVPLQRCRRCGDCATGCNHRAKNSLDQNCLAVAKASGAEIFSGACVESIQPAGKDGALWRVEVTHTEPSLQKREGAPLRIFARRVIVAAGAFGSTALLLNSVERSKSFKVSHRIGRRFSGNGDLLAVVAGSAETPRVNAVADQHQPYDRRAVGPTITGMIDRRAGTQGFVIQEFAIPGPLRRAFEESLKGTRLFEDLLQPPVSLADTGKDPRAVDPAEIANTQILGIMGHDGAGGTLRLGPRSGQGGEPLAWVEWQGIRDAEREGAIFDEQLALLRSLNASSSAPGVVLPNPGWRLLPPALSALVDLSDGPAGTVHPLGGCPMGDDVGSGVVDHIGRVFNPEGTAEKPFHDGLVVLDGSMVPGSIGINPALTISALVIRALEGLIDAWKLRRSDSGGEPPGNFPEPAVRRSVHPPARVPTEVEIYERLEGLVTLQEDSGGTTGTYRAELSLQFSPIALERLRAVERPTLTVDSSCSVLRIYRPDVYRRLREEGVTQPVRDIEAEVTVRVQGELRVLTQERATAWKQRRRAFEAWTVNRGGRDLWQEIFGDPEPTAGQGGSGGKPRRSKAASLKAYWRYFAHAGEARLFEYKLKIHDGDMGSWPFHGSRDPHILGLKRLAYTKGGNPWMQLMEVELKAFPSMSKHASSGPLCLDTAHYARSNRHLVQITRQQDHATALYDVAQFLSYLSRVVLGIHLFSFRKPDAPRPGPLQRRPGKLPGLPDPVFNCFPVGSGKARLGMTRYRRDGSPHRPVLLIHGFSASGSTFAHPALETSFAQHLWNHGFDVWIVELRTSIAWATPPAPWTFEDVAREDIPMAIEMVKEGTGKVKIDVVAHCMGAAMLCMSILDPGRQKPGESPQKPGIEDSIQKLVLSQIGPAIMLSPANIFRGYVISYIRQAAVEMNFGFRPDGSAAGDFLDRFLSTLPYPHEEFFVDNPRQWWKKARHAGTRHRIDALFGRVFNGPNIAPEVLEAIDDMFGSVNLKTASQTLHFARLGMISTAKGRNAFVNPQSLKRFRKMSVTEIHGEANGLADPGTNFRIDELLDQAEVRSFERMPPIPALGHQDCFIARSAPQQVFPKISSFLLKDTQPSGSVVPSPVRLSSSLSFSLDDEDLVADPPWLGPVLGPPDRTGLYPVAAAPDPRYGAPRAMIVVPVQVGETLAQTLERLLATGIPPDCVHLGLIPNGDPAGIAWYRIEVGPLDLRNHSGYLVLFLYNQLPAAARKVWMGGTVGGGGGRASQNQMPERSEMSQALDKLYRRGMLEELNRAVVECPDPARAGGRLDLVVGSCQYPAGPLDTAPAAAAYARLSNLLTQAGAERPRLALLLGDQIYADATAGLMDPTIQDDRFELPYETLYRVPQVQDVRRRLPTLTMLDDHEIDNNWEPLDGRSWAPAGAAPAADSNRGLRLAGLEAYFRHQRPAGPPRTAPAGDSYDPAWYAVRIEGTEYFMADTRTERTWRPASKLQAARIMSEAQWSALRHWLTASPGRDGKRPRFLAAPSLLLPRRRTSSLGEVGALRSDAWDGYPSSMRDLLSHVALHGIGDVVFLSGDEHHCAVARGTLEVLDSAGHRIGSPVEIFSLHSSPTYAPFPFANGDPSDLAASETFEFPAPAGSPVPGADRIRCVVETFFPQAGGDGFLRIREREASEVGAWVLDCEFHLGAGRACYSIGPGTFIDHGATGPAPP